MNNTYRKSSHSLFRIEIHLVWITKYRYKVLKGPIATRTRDLVRRICSEENVEIISGVVSQDHVHLLVSIDPTISIAKLVKFLKGKTSRKLQMELPELSKKILRSTFLSKRIFCSINGKCIIKNDRAIHSSPFWTKRTKRRSIQNRSKIERLLFRTSSP